MGGGQEDFTLPERSQDRTLFLVSICFYQLSVTIIKYWRHSTDREGRAPRFESFDHSRLVPLLWVWASYHIEKEVHGRTNFQPPGMHVREKGRGRCHMHPF